MTFLEEWEVALDYAQLSGAPGTIWKYDRTPADPTIVASDASFRLVARTRHPAFMGVTPAKLDPVRDRLPSVVEKPVVDITDAIFGAVRP
jgi:hypothetical protein